MGDNLISEFREELHRIADWWIDNTLDEQHGGFVGEIDVSGNVIRDADKGIILNSRILWFFSEACCFTGIEKYEEIATRAYDYLVKQFVDVENGGVFWALDYTGKPVDTRKQIYAQAFTIYGLSAYYRKTQNTDALELAKALFDLIETRAHDDKLKGYIEALDRQWQPLDDMRLSVKDMNAPKTMNTHLHILEAYTALQMAAPSPKVATGIKKCLGYFKDYIVNSENNHLGMFFDYNWNDVSDSYSYGHDIESSWLIWEAVAVLGEESLKETFKPLVLAIAETTLKEGVGDHGEVLDAYNFKNNQLVTERMWWVQAEAMVGFLYANEISGNSDFYQAFLNVWSFIKKYQIDEEGGDWHWLSTLDSPHVGDCKMGFWKAPYHNGRAMMEVCKLMASKF